MSSEAEPISLERFAEALKELPLVSLRLKVLEIRNSVSHLIYSNAELKPFAEANPPDEVCVEAIRENEVVLERMAGRISVLKFEVEERGGRWEDFEAGVFERDILVNGTDVDTPGESAPASGDASGRQGGAAVDGERSHPAWSDGTFQVGTIRLGDGGINTRQNGSATRTGLSDAELASQLEERMRILEGEDDADDAEQNGLHL